MHSNLRLLAVFAVPLLFAACGGDNTNPYDGTWAMVYPPLSSASTITDTQIVQCSNPPAPIVIKNSKGSGTASATCITTLTPASGVPSTLPAEVKYANISVSIEAKQAANQKDVMNATVNGAVFVGQCISTQACSATNGTDSLSLTR